MHLREFTEWVEANRWQRTLSEDAFAILFEAWKTLRQRKVSKKVVKAVLGEVWDEGVRYGVLEMM